MSDCFQQTTWNLLREASAYARLGYHHPVALKTQVAQLRQLFEGDVLEPYIASPPGSPPMLLIKGPLFRPADLHGRPQIEFVVTIPQAFPNAYPIITIEQPPQPHYIKRHRHVNFEGCCFLESVSRWNPATGSLAECVKELFRVFEADFPFESNSGGGAAPRPAVRQNTNNNGPPPVPTPASPNAPNVPLQTTAAGMAIGTILTNARSAYSRQPPPQQQQQQQHQHHQQPQHGAAPTPAPYRAPQAPPNFNFEQHDFPGMLRGAQKPPGSAVVTPSGFGLGVIIAAPMARPMSLQGNIPPPLPPVTDPTPDEQFRTTMLQAKQAQSAGSGGFLKSIQNKASDAKFLVEEKVRESVKKSDENLFRKQFPHLNSERLLTTYACKTITGDGTVRSGRVFVTAEGIHFTNKPTETPPPNAPHFPVYAFSVALPYIVSIVLGKEGENSWLHVVCGDKTFRSFFAVSADVSAKVGEFGASAALDGTPYTRLYNWLDHAWRAATNGRVPQHQAPVAPPPPPAVSPESPFGTPEGGDDTCCICMDRAKNCFFRPCGHVCVCMRCSPACTHCPLCRAEVTDRFQAFL